jgi:hypothetical protein
METTDTILPLPDNTPVVVLTGSYRKRRGVTLGKPERAGAYAGCYRVQLEPERKGGKKPEPLFFRSQLQVQS